MAKVNADDVNLSLSLSCFSKKDARMEANLTIVARPRYMSSPPVRLPPDMSTPPRGYLPNLMAFSGEVRLNAEEEHDLQNLMEKIETRILEALETYD